MYVYYIYVCFDTRTQHCNIVGPVLYVVQCPLCVCAFVVYTSIYWCVCARAFMSRLVCWRAA